MLKLLSGMLFSMILFSLFITAIVNPVVDAVKTQFNSAVIEPFNQMENFMNDPFSIPVE